ncbi:MAG: class I mannose-6-phosphate isomerase [Lachnospiraceae bacterium]|nr:class I mannose-6-phosphate isomerase [Lachnospiraceae bacterium]
MSQLLYLKPTLKERIWGGTRLAEYGYELSSDHVGECWGISAHKNGHCVIDGGMFDGMPLEDLWDSHRELFGNCEDENFPLLIKIIDAKSDLSIQVHPDDAYAVEHENFPQGKTECWYVLDAEPGATIIIGHHAKDREELKRLVGERKYSELLREIPVKAGDFFQIEPGCIHSIKGGTMVLETQTNCDITYRIYDYDRTDAEGNRRELHTEQALSVVTVPFDESRSTPKRTVTKYPEAELTKYVSCSFYTVYRVCVDGNVTIPVSGKFHTLSVIDGEGFLEGSRVKKGDHLLLTAGYENLNLVGHFTAVITRV